MACVAANVSRFELVYLACFASFLLSCFLLGSVLGDWIPRGVTDEDTQCRGHIAVSGFGCKHTILCNSPYRGVIPDVVLGP